MKAIHVEPEMMEKAWPHAKPWIDEAFNRGGRNYPLQDIALDIEMGKKRLYKLISGDCFAWLILGVSQNSEHRICLVHAIGGKGAFKFLSEIVEFCEMWAKYNQCKYITCSGRMGWVKALAIYGWEEYSRTCGKEL